MNVELSPKAIKFFRRLNEPMRSRIAAALHKLEHEPPIGDIKTLSGEDGYRVRVGNYRILFDVLNDSIYVHDIGARGQVYKRR